MFHSQHGTSNLIYYQSKIEGYKIPVIKAPLKTYISAPRSYSQNLDVVILKFIKKDVMRKCKHV